MAPVFLSVEQVLRIHADQLMRYGGTDGLRDLGLLESAIAQPSASFDGDFLHEDLAAMAAAYLYHIAQNHPFIDGNKRVAAVASLVFLELNDVEIVMSEDELESTVLSVAASELPKAELAEFLRSRCSPF